MKSLCLALSLVPTALLLPLAALADEYGLKSVGLGVSASQSPYAGAGTSLSLLPLLNYEGEHLFVRGLHAGLHLYQGEGFGLDVIVAGRFDGIDADDFGRRELAENGIDRDLLEDRDDGLDLGLQASWKGALGELQASVRGDVSGASDGYELSMEYGYPLQLGSATVTPSLALNHLSSDLADYYYGTLRDEEQRGVLRYRPGSALVPSLSLGLSQPLGERWLINGEASYRMLPDRLSDSPLSEGDSGQFGVKVGLSWLFD
ncbi:MipA/OmpV family protein [Pseudomonas sp. ML96]|uniref:MipA/OmpV family protein n=1 Tax=Pseudomonas sp. ML96 TaxID=1523503 RepID=UPI0009DFEF1D|nr:MipA/OmpV family protein [Pseudomonas sp. ML96]